MEILVILYLYPNKAAGDFSNRIATILDSFANYNLEQVENAYKYFV